jgi:hypothetical protein
MRKRKVDAVKVIIVAALLCEVMLSGVLFSVAPATAAPVDFNSNNELDNDFVENSGFGVPTQFYQQSSSGGITGGSVTGYSGQNYLATALSRRHQLVGRWWTR